MIRKDFPQERGAALFSAHFPKKHLNPEQNSRRVLKCPVPGKPALRRYFEKKPFSPEAVPVTDQEIDFRQFPRTGLKIVDQLIIDSMGRINGLAQSEGETVKITLHAGGPYTIDAGTEKEFGPEQSFEFEASIRLPSRSRPPEDFLGEPHVPGVEREERPVPWRGEHDRSKFAELHAASYHKTLLRR